MIKHTKGKEILDALFNIKLYGEEDKKQKFIGQDGFQYKPMVVNVETPVSEQLKYGSGLVKTQFDLTKAAAPYYEYLEFKHAVLVGSITDQRYETQNYFTLKSTSPNYVDFSLNHYIGLFTEMPSASNPTGIEPTAPDYKRINLHDSIISGEISVGEAYVDDETGGAAVSNHEIMVFPESNSVGGWGTIVGFGIFEAQTGDEPMFWGRLKQPVVVYQAQVPLFRIGDFKIVLA